MSHQLTDVKFIYDGGSVGLLVANTPAAKEWINDRVPEDTPRFGNGIAVEMRYVDDILNDLSMNGFIVELA